MFADIIKNLEVVLDYWVISESNGECPKRHMRGKAEERALLGISWRSSG